MTDIYLNTSNLRNKQYFDYADRFYYSHGKGINDYDYGFFLVNGLKLHVVLGNMPSSLCPWCDSEPILKSEWPNIKLLKWAYINPDYTKIRTKNIYEVLKALMDGKIFTYDGYKPYKWAYINPPTIKRPAIEE